MPLFELTYAPTAFKLLNGIFCVVKQSGKSMPDVKQQLTSCLAEELNQFKQRPIRQRVVIAGNPLTDPQLKVLRKVSYADHPLVVGPRYQPQDLRVRCVNDVEDETSGLLVMGIGTPASDLAKVIRNSNFVKTFEVKCRFGRATNTYFWSGRTVEKTAYSRVSQQRFQRLIAWTQAGHRRVMYRSMGVDQQSQEAYELAASGLIRPIHTKTMPLLFDIKCTHFDPPDFTIVIQTVNEANLFIGTLVHGLGLRSSTTASIVSLKCTRVGYFTLDKALLPKEWTVENVINNITAHRHLITPERITPSHAKLKLTDVKQIESNGELPVYIDDPDYSRAAIGPGFFDQSPEEIERSLIDDD